MASADPERIPALDGEVAGHVPHIPLRPPSDERTDVATGVVIQRSRRTHHVAAFGVDQTRLAVGDEKARLAVVDDGILGEELLTRLLDVGPLKDVDRALLAREAQRVAAIQDRPVARPLHQRPHNGVGFREGRQPGLEGVPHERVFNRPPSRYPFLRPQLAGRSPADRRILHQEG
jgi:hypothetical protein